MVQVANINKIIKCLLMPIFKSFNQFMIEILIQKMQQSFGLRTFSDDLIKNDIKKGYQKFDSLRKFILITLVADRKDFE